MIITEADRDRFFELAYAWGEDGLQTWRDEINKRIEDRAAFVAEQNVYYVGLVGVTQYRDVQDNVRETEHIQEVYPVKFSELDQFCKQFGLNKLELMDVCELRRKQVTAKGKTWRAGRGTYIDHSAAQEDREQADREDAETFKSVKRRNEAIRNVPFAVPMFPTLKSNWRN